MLRLFVFLNNLFIDPVSAVCSCGDSDRLNLVSLVSFFMWTWLFSWATVIPQALLTMASIGVWSLLMTGSASEQFPIGRIGSSTLKGCISVGERSFSVMIKVLVASCLVEASVVLTWFVAFLSLRTAALQRNMMLRVVVSVVRFRAKTR